MQKYHFIHERGDYPLLAAENIFSAWSGVIKKTVGSGEKPLYFIYQNGWCRIYSLEKNHQQIVGGVFDKILKNKNFVKETKNTFNRKSAGWRDFIKRIWKTDWPAAKIFELIKIKKEYDKLYRQAAPYGEPLPYFLKEKLYLDLNEYLVKELKLSGKEFEILLTPLYQSFLNKETDELYKLAKKYKHRQKLFESRLLKHYLKYRWLLFDYASLEADLAYFKKRAEKLIKNPPKLINYQKIERKRRQLMQKYRIKPRYRYFLGMLDDLHYLMDKKKEILTQAHFAITPLYKEAGRHLGFCLKDIRWFLWQEVEEALINKKKLNLSVLRQRKKFFVIEYNEGQSTFLTKAASKKLIEDIRRDEAEALKSAFIIGVAASPGRVIGRVCNLKSAGENNRIKKGEILVTSNTTPDFMPAIQKAAAIVTNEGGLTCHAAIISRELKIPCVVGTGFATQVLKDGNLVEVDATKGIVRKLSN